MQRNWTTTTFNSVNINFRPISAKGRRVPEKLIKLKNSDESELVLRTLDCVLDFCEPIAPGALLKACLIGSEFISICGLALETQLADGGIEIITHSDLPHGSGLGTSSILASCVIALLWRLQNKPVDDNWSRLLHCVLRVEELLTTGGGWQDQVGGVVGGAKIGRSSTDESGKFLITCQSLKVNTNLLNDRLLLIYTGKTRLAKNLLQTVLKNWREGKKEVMAAFQGLLVGVDECASALERGDLPTVGRCLDRYWELKKVLATDAEPAHVTKLLEMIRPHTHGASLTGAGGGGFLLAVLKENESREVIEDLVKSSQADEIRNCTVHRITVDLLGLQIQETR